MKNRIIALSGLVAFLCAGSAFVVRAQTPAPPTPAPAPGGGKGKAERHPELVKAMRALERAASDLQHADHDFAGHREKALDLTQQAIKECQAAIQADKK